MVKKKKKRITDMKGLVVNIGVHILNMDGDEKEEKCDRNSVDRLLCWRAWPQIVRVTNPVDHPIRSRPDAAPQVALSGPALTPQGRS